MVQTVAATIVTMSQLRQGFGLVKSVDASFFGEWTESSGTLTAGEMVALDRVKANYEELMEDPPLLENSVKMVVLAPLLDLAGFYHKPFRIETETAVDLEMEDEGILIRGRMDVLVLKDRLWLLVIESKRSDFAVTRAIPQALSYMLGNPDVAGPSFGVIVNGSEFLFLKTIRTVPEAGANERTQAVYGVSRLFSLVNPGNDLYGVLQVLRRLGREVINELG